MKCLKPLFEILEDRLLLADAYEVWGGMVDWTGQPSPEDIYLNINNPGLSTRAKLHGTLNARLRERREGSSPLCPRCAENAFQSLDGLSAVRISRIVLAAVAALEDAEVG